MFYPHHWEVMTQWERDFVSSVNRYCDEVGCTPSEKQNKVMEGIYDRCEQRIATRRPKLEE